MSDSRKPTQQGVGAPPPMQIVRRGPGPVMQVEKAKNTKATLVRLLRYIGANKYLFFSLLAIVILTTLITLSAPALQSNAINAITISEHKLSIDRDKLVGTLVIMLVLYVFSSVFTLLQGIFSARLSQNTVKSLRHDLFAKIVKLPIKYLDTHHHGDIMSRMTNDAENISNSVAQSVSSLFSGVISVIGSFIIMLCYSPVLTLVSIVSVFLSAFASKFLSSKMRKYFVAQQRILGSLNGCVEENISGYKTVQAYGRENKIRSEFGALSRELRTCGIKAQIFGGLMGPVMNVIGNFGFLLIATFGGWLALKDVIAIGTIHAFVQYSKQFNRPIVEIGNQWAQIQTALAGAERVFEIMDCDAETDDGTACKENSKIDGDISFKGVDFSYVEGKQVLFDFSLDVKKGQKIAIVGATGSGKTTIVNLLTRFYDVDNGAILVDGVDIRDIPKSTLRKSIAIVLQDTVLFNDTIGANVRYGRLDADDSELKSATKTANADRFIERLPDGYDTMLAESGSNLSQGQRQLLAIARAVLADPQILILDEATSSVDTRTEMHIQNAMIALMQNRTSLIIAHRLSTIRDADRIIVIDKGRIAEQGTHDELLAQKGCYFALYQNQFAGIAT